MKHIFKFNELFENFSIYLDSNESKLLNEKNETSITSSLKNKSKASGISVSILRKVFNKGMSAWNSGHRSGTTQHQWAMGRVNSFITGVGGARKADADLWKKAKEQKKKK